MKVTPPLEGKQAIIRRATLTGVAIATGQGSFGISVGYGRNESILIYDENTAISIQRPPINDFFYFKICTAPPGAFSDNDKSNASEKGVTNPNLWEVKSPSFLAMLDNSSTFTQPAESGVSHVQFFATGKAATKFALRPEINKKAFANMVPDVANIPKKENSTVELNKELVKDIRKIYNAKDSNKKDEVVNKAIKLMLVSPHIGRDNLIDQLAEKAEEPNPIVSNKLNELRVFIIAQSS